MLRVHGSWVEFLPLIHVNARVFSKIPELATPFMILSLRC